MDGKEPCRLIISGVGINMLATVESFEQQKKLVFMRMFTTTSLSKEYKMAKARFVKSKEGIRGERKLVNLRKNKLPRLRKK